MLAGEVPPAWIDEFRKEAQDAARSAVGKFEEAVKRDPAVADCVAVGVPDERFGEVVTAVVAAEPGARVDAERLMTTSRGLARYKRPRHVVVVDEIKRGPNGKADYRWARDTATDQLGLPAR